MRVVWGVGITTGWGETEVFMEVSSRRLAIVQHRHPHVLVTSLEGCTVLLFYSEFCHKIAVGTKGNLVCFRQKESGFCMFLSKRERPTGGKKWTWTRPFARPRPSSTSDEGGSAVPNSRLITAVIWISRIPMDITGPLGSTQTTTTATAMRQKTRPPRNQTRAEWEMEWKARRKRWELWRAIVSIMSGELRSSSGFAVVTRRTAPVG